ncbi:MAG TPA: GxxExxY protein [Tepidisphaeraceae bacterium]|nr:GxxExxY protein [Tepidisphaeraceae bacterium]
MSSENEPAFSEPDPQLSAVTGAIIGAAIEVHRHLGPGLDEAIYEEAMAVELMLRNIEFARQVIVRVPYKDRTVGEKRLDLIVAHQVVVELKAVELLSPLHKAQVHTYLRITGFRIGLLINFNTLVLKDGIARIISS